MVRQHASSLVATPVAAQLGAPRNRLIPPVTCPRPYTHSLNQKLTPQTARKATVPKGCIANGRLRCCTPWLRRVAASTRYRVAQEGERWLWRTSRKRLAAPVTSPCAITTGVVRLAIISFLIATRLMADLIRGSLGLSIHRLGKICA